MKKKLVILILLSAITFITWWITSAMNMEALTYEDLLTLYFWVLNPERKKPTAEPELLFTNVEKWSKLYSILSTAVYNNKFPNLKIALPLNKTAQEQDLADLIKNNFWKKIVYSENKVLTFEFLQVKLKSIYNKWTYIQSITTQKEEKANSEIADSVLFLLKENYINKDQLSWTDSINSNNLSEFVDTLWEEYTVYYNSEEGKKFMDSLNWEFAWIWVYLIQKWLSNPVISEVIKDSPADKAWLQAEDIILSIDWKTILDFWSADLFIDALKWDKDSSVKVQVKRWYSVLTKEIIRDNIHLPTVDSVKVWDICYIRLYSFDIWAYKKFMSEIKWLWDCWKYVFDIRSNPGGVIEEVVNVLDEFVPEWKTIFTQKWVKTTEVIKSNNEPSLKIKDPTVILIDWYTASAAEIFAWVMKYYFPNEVKLVWSQSYGKWSVQQVVQFPNNSIIKYTIGIWYIADNDVTIDKVGLKPDITVIDNPYTQKDEVLELIGLKSK